MSPNLVSVGKLTVNCTVPRDHPHPERVRWRLDDVVAGPLHAALATLLEPLARLHSDEVLIIKRLELSFDLDTSRDVAEVARRWAARLAEQLALALSPEARATQLHFADDASYLARFLVDSVAGQASGKWYYRRFAGWSALPLPAILRSAILDATARGLAALRTLPAAELGPVLAALGAREAQRIVQSAIDGDGQDDDADGAADALVRVADTFAARDLGPSEPSLVALVLTALAAELVEPSRLASLARLALAVATWIESERAGGGDTSAARARAAATAAVASDAPPDLTLLRALTPSRRAQLERALRPRAPAAAPRREADIGSAHTRFGGLVLLLARTAQLPLEGVFSDERDRALLRLILVARCAGPQRRRQVIGDTLLQRLCGLGPDGTTATETDDWLARHAGTLAGALAPALVGARGPMARSLRLAVGRAPAFGTIALHVAEPDGYWLGLAPLSPAVRAQLRTTRDLRLATARALSRVLFYLAAADPATPLDAELALVMAAQHVLHGFARTLPGFADSSPSFLFDNFLQFSAIVDEVGERRICRMGKPPLAALLALTGAQRGRLALPWLDGAALELYPGG